MFWDYVAFARSPELEALTAGRSLLVAFHSSGPRESIYKLLCNGLSVRRSSPKVMSIAYVKAELECAIRPNTFKRWIIILAE